MMMMMKLRSLEGKFGFKPVVVAKEKLSTIFNYNTGIFYFSLAYLSAIKTRNPHLHLFQMISSLMPCDMLFSDSFGSPNDKGCTTLNHVEACSENLMDYQPFDSFR